ncbi:hypothetical protein KIW84_020970 [Lathyrus oleraceus]|uniref:ATP-dependent DNA helicase n=1 Tax=Pisum sativum TaxID=3888 RepID=A0A9D4YC79_PEA|nr:hypothetical protein KIW84_020970 [Pisum sativum]
MLLKDLNELLNLHGKKIDDYDLPSLAPNTIDRGAVPSIIQEKLAIDIPNEDIESIAKLNNDQMIAFNTIMNVIVQKHSGVFFVDGPGGTGKTFLYRTLMAILRSRGEIILTTASSGIAATLLPGGRTAHSRFKIPIDIQPSSICGIEKQKDLANLIRVAAAIIWDEAPMTNKKCLEALDRSLQDICSNSAPFGGKVLIMGGGGDFRQVLPVVRKGTKAQMISACIVQSHLWNHTKILHLRQNMRSLHDQEFVEFLIRIGDGVEPTKPDDMVRLPLHIAIPWEGEHSIQVVIQHIFPDLELHGWDAPYMVQRAILTPTNDDVQKLNDMIIDQFPGEEHNLLSFDEVEGDNHNLYQQEFLNSIAHDSMDYGRDINVIRYDGNLKKVQETKGYYDPLQYPVLFPFGTHGWDINTTNCNGRRVSCRAYYSYMLQIRPNDQSMLLNTGRLLQQYVVDNYVKIESGRLRWIKEHQSDIRSELYQCLHDALHVGETNAENIGKRTILPLSFIGDRRDMTQRYEDGMAIVLNGGKPDIFITKTCNPSWSEITSELLPFQTPQDRPDLLTRIFRSKLEKLKDNVINKGVLGKVKSYMYVTEFQKRGLSHVHMLLVLESNDKLCDPKDYDSMVREEIPKLECEPELHEAVVRHMIHGPCGIINRKSPCMKDGHCKKRYPKQFLDETRQGTDSYPEYRRRFDESVSLGKDRSVDNRWVVPYNPWLLLKYDCHINVEICSSIKSIKYLYKYVYKGPDRVAMEVHKGSYMDEVQ